MARRRVGHSHAGFRGRNSGKKLRQPISEGRRGSEQALREGLCLRGEAFGQQAADGDGCVVAPDRTAVVAEGPETGCPVREGVQPEPGKQLGAEQPGGNVAGLG